MLQSSKFYILKPNPSWISNLLRETGEEGLIVTEHFSVKTPRYVASTA